MAKIAKTADRKKVMDTTKSTDCPKCSKPTRIVKRVKDRERGTPGGVYISCSACEFYVYSEISPARYAGLFRVI
jgi:RNase P subunit RPR2